MAVNRIGPPKPGGNRSGRESGRATEGSQRRQKTKRREAYKTPPAGGTDVGSWQATPNTAVRGGSGRS
jgi:hypothetical protein